MKYTCPKCGKDFEISQELLNATGDMTVCPNCHTTLKIVGDYAYVPTAQNPIEPTPPPFNHQPDESERLTLVHGGRDPLFDDAVRYLQYCNAITVPMLQRYFNIDEARATSIMQQLEQAGYVAPFTGGPRKILIKHSTSLPGYNDNDARFDPNNPLPDRDELLNNPNVKTFSCSSTGCFMIILLLIIATIAATLLVN